jgi:hypothetical protein
VLEIPLLEAKGVKCNCIVFDMGHSFTIRKLVNRYSRRNTPAPRYFGGEGRPTPTSSFQIVESNLVNYARWPLYMPCSTNGQLTWHDFLSERDVRFILSSHVHVSFWWLFWNTVCVLVTDLIYLVILINILCVKSCWVFGLLKSSDVLKT